ncbi:uncharacterized protein LOC131642584, partial [Vicia villosa]|uniref:uncharacterized protein LOC131642584 n=1 Tax=Vicia villosa TaxID=3911 RepID=UPI00273CA28A
MLSKEAHDWWVATRAELDANGVAITWVVFRREFLRRYFPEDVRGRKEIEFLELKQGNMSVPKYASKFVELSKYYTHYYNDEARKLSKCIKFENGLRDEIKQGIRNECKSEEKKYFNSGKVGHIAFDCRMKSVTCYNCDEEGHNNPQCTKPKKNQAGGKVFALSGSETTPEDQLIKAAGAKDLEMTARQVGEAVKDVAAVFMLFASMELKGKVVSSELPVVREYLE